jgi:hypothetical protein
MFKLPVCVTNTCKGCEWPTEGENLSSSAASIIQTVIQHYDMAKMPNTIPAVGFAAESSKVSSTFMYCAKLLAYYAARRPRVFARFVACPPSETRNCTLLNPTAGLHETTRIIAEHRELSSRVCPHTLTNKHHTRLKIAGT